MVEWVPHVLVGEEARYLFVDVAACLLLGAAVVEKALLLVVTVVSGSELR